MTVFINIACIMIIVIFLIISYFRDLKKNVIKLGFFYLLAFLFVIVSKNIAKSVIYNDFTGLIKLISGFNYRTVVEGIENEVIYKLMPHKLYLNTVITKSVVENSAASIIRVFLLLFFCILILPLTEGLFVMVNKLFKGKIGNKETGNEETKIHKTLKLVLGLIWSFSFLLLMSSPFTVIFDFVGSNGNHKFTSEYKNSFAYALGSNPLANELASISYNDRNIYLRDDLDDYEKLISIDKEKGEDLKEMLFQVKDLKIIDPAISCLIEYLVLKKEDGSNYIKSEVVDAIYGNNYNEELNTLYKLYGEYTFLIDDDTTFATIYEMKNDDILRLSNYLGNLKSINILIPYYKEEVLSYLGLYDLGLDNLNLRGVDYNSEIEVIGEVIVSFKNTNFLDGEITDFDKLKLDSSIAFIDKLYKSKIFQKNSKLFGEVVLDYLLEESLNYQVNSFNYEDLNSIIRLLIHLGDNGVFSNDINKETLFRSESIEEIISHLSSSELLRHNTEVICNYIISKSLELDGGNFPEIVIADDVLKSGDQYKDEIRSLIYLLRIFAYNHNNIENKGMILQYLSDLKNENYYSTIFKDNLMNLFDYLAMEYYKGIFTINYDNFSFRENEDEFYNILNIFEKLVSNELLAGKKLENLDSAKVDELALALSSSLLARANLTNFINYNILKINDRIKISPIIASDDYTYLEIKSLFRAYNIIQINSYNINNLIRLNELDLELILSSYVAFWSIVNFICELGEDKINNGEIIKADFDVSLSNNNPSWDIEGEQIGELRKLINGLKSIDIDYSKTKIDINIIHKITTGIDGEDDNLSVILKSIILSDTIIYQIKSLDKNPNDNTGYLIVDIYDEDWLDFKNGRPGEVRNFIRGSKLIFARSSVNLTKPIWELSMLDNLTDGTVDTNNDGIIDDNDSNDLREILRSKIISDTIIFLVVEEAKKNHKEANHLK